MDYRVALIALIAFMGCEEKKVEMPEVKQSSGNSVEVSKTFRIEGPTASLKANSKGTASLTVKPRSGFDINPEFPWKFTFDDPHVVSKTVDKSTIKFEDQRAVVPFEVDAKAAGKLPMVAMGSFSICIKGDNGKCFFVKDEPFPIEVSVE